MLNHLPLTGLALGRFKRERLGHTLKNCLTKYLFGYHKYLVGNGNLQKKAKRATFLFTEGLHSIKFMKDGYN